MVARFYPRICGDQRCFWKRDYFIENALFRICAVCSWAIFWISSCVVAALGLWYQAKCSNAHHILLISISRSLYLTASQIFSEIYFCQLVQRHQPDSVVCCKYVWWYLVCSSVCSHLCFHVKFVASFYTTCLQLKCNFLCITANENMLLFLCRRR